MAITSKNWSTSLSNKQEFDTGLLLIVVLFFGLGLVQVYTSSFIYATEVRGDGLFFLKRQAIFTVLSLSTLLAFAFLPWKIVRTIGLFTFFVALISVGLTLIPGIGFKAGGAARWINLGLFNYEPSELLKVSLPILLGVLMTAPLHRDTFWDRVLKFVLVLSPLPLLLHQPDFGTFAIYSTVVMIILFIFGMSWLQVSALVLTILPTFYFLVMNVPYRKARLMAYLDPWADPAKSGFQVIQSLLSFSSGGLTGVGLGQGQGKLFFLPEAHTDFTLAVLGEETGFIGFTGLIFLYGFLIFRGFQIGSRVKDKAAKVTAMALSVLFFLQVFTNIGVVLGLLPTKGLTLPFLSYGGSSLVVTGMLFGILMNIERTFLRQTSH